MFDLPMSFSSRQTCCSFHYSQKAAWTKKAAIHNLSNSYVDTALPWVHGTL